MLIPLPWECTPSQECKASTVQAIMELQGDTVFLILQTVIQMALFSPQKQSVIPELCIDYFLSEGTHFKRRNCRSGCLSHPLSTTFPSFPMCRRPPAKHSARRCRQMLPKCLAGGAPGPPELSFRSKMKM